MEGVVLTREGQHGQEWGEKVRLTLRPMTPRQAIEGIEVVMLAVVLGWKQVFRGA